MVSGSDEQLPHWAENHTFPGNFDGGVFTNSYLAVENQGDNGIDALLRSVQSPDPRSAQALRQLQLPNDDFDFQKFIQILKELGYSINADVAMLSRRNSRQYTKATGRESSRALLYIPQEILLKPTPENLDAITSICSVFTKESILIVFSKTDEFADSEIRRIVQYDWPTTSHVGKIVPWKDVKSLIEDFDGLRDERDQIMREQLLESIKKEIEIMLEGLMPLKDS